MTASPTRTTESRIAAVRAIVAAARTLAVRPSALVPAIADSTGLSTAGVELALTRHLEVDPSDEELHRLVERAGNATRVVVFLSANVFVGALRAIALARAAASDVIVRPSRRDPAFARALVDEVRDPGLRIDEAIDVTDVSEGEIHVYGRDETIADIRRRVQEGVRVRGHGSGMGVAWISACASIEASARDLADDVVAFDQRGCLSPRIALVEGDLDRTSAIAEALHVELERLDVVVPRGVLPGDERAASDRYIGTMTYACRALVGTGHAIGIAPPGAPMILAPPYRHVHVAACATPENARQALMPMMRSIVAVGSDDETEARKIAPAWARISRLGRMQRPPLDGPVDLRET